MSPSRENQVRDYVVIPARTLRGSPREMIEDIDLTVAGLLALRGTIAGTNAGGSSASVPLRGRGRVHRLLSLAFGRRRPG